MKHSKAALSVSTRSPKNNINTFIHIRDRADTKASHGGSVAHIPSERTPVTTSWSQTRSTSYAKVIHLDSSLEETLHATEVPLTSPPKDNWKRQTQMLRVLSGQAIEILQLAHSWCNDQTFDRVMSVTRETSTFGGSAMAGSFVHFRSVRKKNLQVMH